jgi:hypothetical protein
LHVVDPRMTFCQKKISEVSALVILLEEVSTWRTFQNLCRRASGRLAPATARVQPAQIPTQVSKETYKVSKETCKRDLICNSAVCTDLIMAAGSCTSPGSVGSRSTRKGGASSACEEKERV